MRTFFAKALVLSAALLLGSNAMANDNIWFGVKAGTLGLGLEASWRPIPWFDIRAGLNRFDFDVSGFQAGIDYDSTFELETYYATANFRFPLSPFRMTLGAYSNGNEVQLSSLPVGTYLIGNNPIPFTAADVGTVRGTVSFDGVSPYLGAGFDLNVAGRLGLALDFGILLQGEPIVTATVDGLLALDPAFLAEVENERLQLEDEASSLKAYPVISIGFNFNF